MLPFIKTRRVFAFTDDGFDIANNFLFISAGAATLGKRSFILGRCHKPYFNKDTLLRMEEGKRIHEKLQEGTKTIEQYGYLNYRRDLYKHKVIVMNEVKVFSLEHALYGVIDMLTVVWTEDGVVNILFEDYKPTNKNPKYKIQMLVYAMILSDLRARLVYLEKRPRSEHKTAGLLYPKPESIKMLNIMGRIYSYNPDEKNQWVPIVVKNEFVGSWAGLKAGLEKKLKQYREYLWAGQVDLSKIPHDKGMHCCKTNPSICPKVNYTPKAFQRYISPSKLQKEQMVLVKTKPRLI